VISYGVSSYGYDVRVGRHFKVFTNARCAVVDPKNFDPASFVDIEGDSCLIPPNSFALAETVEYLEIPRNIIVNEGGIMDLWVREARIFKYGSGTGTNFLKCRVAQILFFRGDAVCQISYGDKRGKYQDQKGLTLPFVVGADGLGVGEGEHVRFPGQSLDEQAVRFLPAMQAGLCHVGLAEGVYEQPVDQQDRSALSGRGPPGTFRPSRRDLYKLRFDGRGGAEQTEQEG
jgi:dCTP deaminase